MSAVIPIKKKLGLWTSTSLVIGNMIGAGVFMLPATLATFGGISLIGWLVSSVGALLLARIFSRLSTMLPQGNGGPYAYTRKAFGDLPGYMVAWSYWVSVWCTNATIAVSLVSALSIFFPPLTTHALAAITTGLGAIWLLTWINTLGIRESGNMQLATTILKLIPLIIVAIGGLFYLHPEHFKPFNLTGGTGFSAITASATLTFFAFTGLESATIPAGNVDNPAKTIARATMLGTIIATLVYVLGTISVMGLIAPRNLEHSGTPFADAAVVIWGKGASYWVGAGVVIAAFGALNGWILIQGQISAALAKDKLFPSLFEKENSRGVPAAGIIVGSILVSVFMLMNFSSSLVDQFRFLLLLTTITTLVPYLFSMASYAVLSIKGRDGRSWALGLKLVSACLAFLFCLWVTIGSGVQVMLWGLVLIIAGLPFYFWNKHKTKNNQP